MNESDKAVMQQALDALKNSCDFIFKDVTKSHLRHQAIAVLEAAIEQPEQPAVSKAVAYRYRLKGDLQWQYTETLAQATQPCEIQYLYIAQPVQPAPQNLQNRLAYLHLYEEIAEHYAKCAVSPEALRDWVAERVNSKPAVKKATP